MCSPANARRLLDAMERLEAGRGVAHDLVESDRRAARRGRERREDYLWGPAHAVGFLTFCHPAVPSTPGAEHDRWDRAHPVAIRHLRCS